MWPQLLQKAYLQVSYNLNNNFERARHGGCVLVEGYEKQHTNEEVQLERTQERGKVNTGKEVRRWPGLTSRWSLVARRHRSERRRHLLAVFGGRGGHAGREGACPGLPDDVRVLLARRHCTRFVRRGFGRRQDVVGAVWHIWMLPTTNQQFSLMHYTNGASARMLIDPILRGAAAHCFTCNTANFQRQSHLNPH